MRNLPWSIGKKIKILFYITIHDQIIYLIWSDQEVQRISDCYTDIVYLQMISNKSASWRNGKRVYLVSPRYRSQIPLFARFFLFCNSCFIRVPHSSTKPMQQVSSGIQTHAQYTAKVNPASLTTRLRWLAGYLWLNVFRIMDYKEKLHVTTRVELIMVTRVLELAVRPNLHSLYQSTFYL